MYQDGSYVEGRLPGVCVLSHFGRDFDPVVPATEQEDDSHVSSGVGGFQSGTDRLEVLERLAHLGARYTQMSDVQEVVDPRVLACAATVKRLTLGELVVVVREGQIDTARVDIHLLTKLIRRHDRALDMPTRATIAPWTLPVGLAGFRFLPQRKVTGALFSTGGLGQRAFSFLLQSLVVFALRAQSGIGIPVFLERRDVEVNGALRLIRIALLHETLDESDDLGQILGDSGQVIGSENIQRVHVRREFLLHGLGEVRVNGLVVDVDGLLVERVEIGQENLLGALENVALLESLRGSIHVVDVHFELGLGIARFPFAGQRAAVENVSVRRIPSYLVARFIDEFVLGVQKREIGRRIGAEGFQTKSVAFVGGVGFLFLELEQSLPARFDDDLPTTS